MKKKKKKQDHDTSKERTKPKKTKRIKTEKRTSVTLAPDGDIKSTITHNNQADQMFWGKHKLNTPKTYRTRVGNRRDIISGVDLRDKRVRRAREIYFNILSDLGGMDSVTQIQDIITKSLAFLMVSIEDQMFISITDPDAFELVVYLASVKTATQIGRTLGLKKIRVTIDQGLTTDPESVDEFLKDMENEIKRRKKKKAKGTVIDANFTEVESDDNDD